MEIIIMMVSKSLGARIQTMKTVREQFLRHSYMLILSRMLMIKVKTDIMVKLMDPSASALKVPLLAQLHGQVVTLKVVISIFQTLT